MVVIGDYSVRLVEAETKVAFKEHDGPGGKTYSEVEPGVNYLIEVDVVGGSPSTMHMFDFTVDDKILGYNIFRSLGSENYYCGLFSRQDGVENMRAFSFQRPSFANGSGDSASVSGGLMGQVTIDISEAVYAGIETRAQTDFSGSAMSPASVTADLTHAQTKKVLRSGEGSYCESKKATKIGARAKYVRGPRLESVTINYCTALGLVKAGVLAKPKTIWEEARIANPAKRGSSNTPAMDVKPKRVKRGAIIVDETVDASKETDLFDLTAESDDES